MSKHILAFLLPILLVLLAGCRSEGTTQPTPTHYWTALEAYGKIKPAMLAWHEDAVVVYISSSRSQRPEWRIHADGRAARWGFSVHSPSALKSTSVYWVDGEVTIGIDGIPGKEVSTPSAEPGLPLDEMIDSDEVVEIALESGASTDDVLLRMKIDHYDSASDSYIPPSWGLTYADPHGSSQQRRIIIDVVTGEVIRNDFAE